MNIIIEDGIRIGFFQNPIDRDIAFDRYILPRSINCIKFEDAT